ncbi:hypothetical protein RKD23_005027 [Streptomyces sp. SAI-170]
MAAGERRACRGSPLPDGVFSLGVASGDTLPDARIRVVDTVRQPTSAGSTLARLRVEAGRPGVQAG